MVTYLIETVLTSLPQKTEICQMPCLSIFTFLKKLAETALISNFFWRGAVQRGSWSLETWVLKHRGIRFKGVSTFGNTPQKSLIWKSITLADILLMCGERDFVLLPQSRVKLPALGRGCSAQICGPPQSAGPGAVAPTRCTLGTALAATLHSPHT